MYWKRVKESTTESTCHSADDGGAACPPSSVSLQRWREMLSLFPLTPLNSESLHQHL